MLRRLLLAAILILAWPAIAQANACVCSGGACTDASATNWSSCGATFPQAADTFTVAAGGTFTLTGNRTYVSGIVQNGGIMTHSGSATKVLTFSSTALSPSGLYVALDCQPGSTCNFAATSAIGPTNFTMTGAYVKATGCAGADCGITNVPEILQCGSYHTQMNSSVDATCAFTGQEKVVTTAAWYGVGTTAGDTIDCIYAPATAAATVADGDTIVFTSGKSDNFWYRVVVPQTAECTNKCDQDGDGVAGEACTYQIDRGNTGASWNSLTLATGRDTYPLTEANPLDTNNDGTSDADGNGTRPASGDSFVIFTPETISGSADDVTKNLAAGNFGGAQLNMRYVEAFNVGIQKDVCTNAAHKSSAPFIFEVVAPTNAAGDIAFVNIHDMMGDSSSMENHGSDRRNDSRPNYAATYRYFYIHDRPASLLTCNGGGVAANQELSSGVSIYNLAETDISQMKDQVYDHFHLARLGGRLMIGSNAPAASPFLGDHWSNITWSNWMYHDSPKTATYPTSSGSVSQQVLVKDGTNILFSNIAMWNVGNNTIPALGWSLDPKSEVADGARNKIRVQGLWVVDIDRNADGNLPLIDATSSLSGAAQDYDTSSVTISNSYFGSIVSGVGQGGAWYYNFIKNVNIDDDDEVGGGTTLCAISNTPTYTNEYALFLPVDVIGNVFLADATQAKVCTNSWIWDETTNQAAAGDSFAHRTRRYVSNYFGAPINKLKTTSNAAEDPRAIFLRDAGNLDPYNVDIYNNFFDMRWIKDPDEVAAIYSYPWSGAVNGSQGVITLRYNIFANNTEAGGGVVYSNGAGTLLGNVDEDYDYYLNNKSDSYGITFGSHSVSRKFNATWPAPTTSDVIRGNGNDILETTRCSAPLRNGSVAGTPIGPLRYGIDSFSGWHAAIMALLPAQVFQMRYNWQDCGTVYQDAIPR